MKLLKWLGTGLCLIGISLTSFNLYPYNVLFSLVGSFIWSVCGILQKDLPLFVVEIVAVLVYISGMVYFLTSV